uniref:Olfactory receptor C family, x2 n=1 Tax=Paramormyrops kingsleyae TaxID=1676925 RepID=A0A3B3SEK5_9TELE
VAMALLAAWLLASSLRFMLVKVGEPMSAACVFQGEEDTRNLYKEGDVVIGGLFPVHYSPRSFKPSYQKKPDCFWNFLSFSARALRWTQTMAFAIEEINQRRDLLPRLKLGYHIRDSCDDIPVSLRSSLLLVTFRQNSGFCWANSKLIRYFHWTWVGVIGVESDYARFAIQLFLEESSKYGACAAYVHFYPVLLSKESIADLMQTIRGSTAKVILNFSGESELQTILTECRRQNMTHIQWIASEAWATAKSLWGEFQGLLTGTLGFAIRKAEIPGLQGFLTRGLLVRAHQSPFFAELWEETFNCKLNVSLNRHVHSDAALSRRPCAEEEEAPEAVRSDYSDVSQLRVSYNVYKAVYLVAQALHDMSGCTRGAGPFENGTCATRKGEPICCFDCLPCTEGEINSLDCRRCSVETWPNEAQDHCVPKTTEFLSYHGSMGIVLCTCSLFGLFVTMAIFGVFVAYRTTPVVRGNNMELSFLLLIFLSVCFLSGLTFIGEPTDWLCRIRYTTFGISFSLCISCILAKTVVVLMAFRATLPDSRVMRWFGPAQQRASVFLCTCIQIVICLIWLTTRPPLAVRNTRHHSSRIILECVVGSDVGFWSVLGYIGLLACLCFLLAFLARKLPDNFNEAKFITFSMLIFFAVWITFIPVYISTSGQYMVAVHIFAILASAFGILLCIFAPKCYIVLLKPEKNTKKQMMLKK